MKTKFIFFFVLCLHSMVVQLSGQVEWLYLRPEFKPGDENAIFYTSSANLPDGSSILGGFVVDDIDNDPMMYSLLTLVDSNGKVIRDSIFLNHEGMGIVYVAGIPGSDGFYTLMSGLYSPDLVTVQWSLDFTSQIIDHINLPEGIFNSDFIFRYRKNFEGNLLFHTSVSSEDENWLSVFEINVTGNISSHTLVEEMFCECLIPKRDKTGYFCIARVSFELDKDFDPTRIIEMPRLNMDYFGLDAEIFGDSIIMSAVINDENEEPLLVLLLFDKNMNFLDSIHLVGQYLTEGLVFKNLNISKNNEVMCVYNRYTSNFSGNQYVVAVTNPSLSDLKQHPVYTSQEETLGVAFNFEDPDHLYISGNLFIDNDETNVPMVIKISKNVLTSISNNVVVPKINVYPNPATHEIIVGEAFKDHTNFNIIKIDGTVAKEGKLLPNVNSSISISDLSSGYYILLFSDNQKLIGTSVFSKN